MFLCKECHEKNPEYFDAICRDIEPLMKSRGSCEVCGKVADCVDCYSHKRVRMPNA